MKRLTPEDLEPYDVAIENLERLVAELASTNRALAERVRELEAQRPTHDITSQLVALDALSTNWWV